ncbi:unnamed protein product [Mesocestoides corti]|uniref:Uncharacterized protein n=1 Tax=Mesocestoides corti TaxID=53468 RepID=A0A0R3UCZ4_MESCO|nr:unnamed protein product [Mesocestoides corti]
MGAGSSHRRHGKPHPPTTVSDNIGYPGAECAESTQRNSEDGSDAVDVPAFATYIDAHAFFPPLFGAAGNSMHQTESPTQGNGLAALGRFSVFANEVVASTQEDQQQDDAPSLLHVTGDVRTVSFAALDAEIHRRNLSAWRR